MPNRILTQAIDSVASGRDLSADQAAAVLLEVMEGRSSEVETAGFLIALRAKGETVDEVVGLARTMRELATRVDAKVDDLLDTAGTGGGAPSFNVSTAAALVAAAAGARVAKHGNRSSTSQCGSADVLEALGGRIELPPDAVAECIEDVGFGFMFAPAYHRAMKHVVPVRKALGVRTIFNLLGPLTNPAGASHQVIGVSDPAFLDLMAHALRELGADSALIVSSEDGLDELSVAAPTTAVRLQGGEIERFTIEPPVHAPEPLPAGDPAENARIVRGVFAGEEGAAREIVLLNAAAALYAAGRAESLDAGREQAAGAIDNAMATNLLERWIEKTNELAA